MSKWVKIGTISKHLANMYGKEESNIVIYVDNWARGSYAVVLGIEIPARGKYLAGYREKDILANVGSRKEANAVIKEYMRTH